MSNLLEICSLYAFFGARNTEKLYSLKGPDLPFARSSAALRWNGAAFAEVGTDVPSLNRGFGGAWEGADFYDTATNLNPFSEAFQSWSSTTNTTVTDDPDSVFRKVEATATGATNLRRIVASAGSASGNTFQIFARKGSGATDANKFLLRNDTASASVASCTINYDTGAITTTAGTCRAIALPGGVYKILLSSSAISAGDDLSIYAAFTGGSETAGEHAFFWGAQLHAGLIDLPPIPTAGSAVTRGADNSITTGAAFDALNLAGASGFLFARWISAGDAAGTKYVLMAGPSSTARIGLLQTSAGRVRGAVNAPTTILTPGPTIADRTTRISAALTWNETTLKIAVNGGAVGSVELTEGLPTIDRLHIGRRDAGDYLNSRIIEVGCGGTFLSDETLTAYASSEL